jgi:hypothetical protein
MRGASFRDMAGVEAGEQDVRGMLKLNETLFVEHKGAAPEFQLAKAMASFANQLGGWVLVNIGPDGEPIGPLQDWVRKGASPVDVIRDRLQGRIDPMPPFEARTFALDHDEDDVLLIRIYESADTPHIVGDGAIYIRAVAQDQRRDKYEARAIENQQTLRALVERGERSRERTDELLAPRRHGLPLANTRVGSDSRRSPKGSCRPPATVVRWSASGSHPTPCRAASAAGPEAQRRSERQSRRSRG